MSIEVISFSDEPKVVSRRCLRDLPDRVVDGDPQHVTKIYFKSDDSTITSGTWVSTPGKWIAFTGKDEFCFIVSGHCRLISESGEVNNYRKGDAFLFQTVLKVIGKCLKQQLKTMLYFKKAKKFTIKITD